MFILIEFKKISFQTCTLYFMDLLSKELRKIFCPQLILPIFQLAEVIANEVVECGSLSDLYHLRFVSFILNKRETEWGGPSINASLNSNMAFCDLLFYICNVFYFF